MHASAICLPLLAVLSVCCTVPYHQISSGGGGGAAGVDTRVINPLTAGHLLILLTEYTRKTGVFDQGWALTVNNIHFRIITLIHCSSSSKSAAFHKVLALKL